MIIPDCVVTRRSYCLQAGVSVSWDGRRVLAPPGVMDTEGFLDLRPYM